MKIISWNIRDHRPDILLVQESKMPKEKVEKIKMFQFCGVEGNNFEGASGGIVTF